MIILKKVKDLILRKGYSKSNISLERVRDNFESEMTKEPEKTLDELYEGKSDDEIWSAILEKDEDDLTREELSFNLEMTLHNEHSCGRSLAIKSLVNNEYEILPDKYGNPFQELINFTLLYFANSKFTDNVELKNIIQNYFPVMYKYLFRQVNKINPKLLLTYSEIDDNHLFDEQNAYDEFINFMFILFTKNFKDKNERDFAIERNFNIMAGDLILYIERELLNDKKGST
jgi:hypothetical protein